jgi:hypothetical protein
MFLQKLNTSAISDKTLDGSFKTLRAGYNSSTTTYSLANTTLNAPNISTISKTLANYATDFNVTPLPAGDYTLVITNIGGINPSNPDITYNGYVTVTTSGYSNLVDISKGIYVTSVVITGGTSLTITYYSSNGTTNTNGPLDSLNMYYRVTMTPFTCFEAAKPSRFNDAIGLPFSYTTLPMPHFLNLAVVVYLHQHLVVV